MLNYKKSITHLKLERTIFFLANLYAQKNDIWISESDSLDLESYGYVDSDNNVKIPFGKYAICFSDTFRTYAAVHKSGEGFIAIDKQENKLFTIYPFDNGPDYEVEGTFRIIDNDKIGFADTTGSIIIPTIYDFAFSFTHGLALVNNGGRSVSIDPQNPKCEYHTCKGGKWGVIDKMGNLILPIEFDYICENETRKITLQKENQRLEILNGIIIKR